MGQKILWGELYTLEFGQHFTLQNTTIWENFCTAALVYKIQKKNWQIEFTRLYTFVEKIEFSDLDGVEEKRRKKRTPLRIRNTIA